MARPLPVLGLALLVVLAGCLGGFRLGGSSQPTTTTTTTQTTITITSTAAPTNTTTTTTATQTQTEMRTTTSVARNTSVHIDPPDGGERFKARVVKVLDPETIRVKQKGGETVVVDLIGIETPESAGNTNPVAFEGVPSSQQGRQLLGRIHNRSLRYTKSQLWKQVVTVATDPNVGKTESGYLRAYVFIGNFMYNSQLLRIVYARVTDAEFSKRPLFMQKLQRAQQNGYGVWGANQPD